MLGITDCAAGDVSHYLFFTFFTLALSVLTAYSVYRFCNKHKISEDRNNQFITFILGSFALISILMFLYLILTPWTTFEGSTNKFDKMVNTSIRITPVYEHKGEMIIQVSNTGKRAINVSKYDISYGPQEFRPISYYMIKSQLTNWSVGGEGNQCFTSNMSKDTEMDSDTLATGERATCSTGVKFTVKMKQFG